jgi:hypothetical protein
MHTAGLHGFSAASFLPCSAPAAFRSICSDDLLPNSCLLVAISDTFSLA